jgi:hypothetical protein
MKQLGVSFATARSFEARQSGMYCRTERVRVHVGALWIARPRDGVS